MGKMKDLALAIKEAQDLERHFGKTRTYGAASNKKLQVQTEYGVVDVYHKGIYYVHTYKHPQTGQSYTGRSYSYYELELEEVVKITEEWLHRLLLRVELAKEFSLEEKA